MNENKSTGLPRIKLPRSIHPICVIASPRSPEKKSPRGTRLNVTNSGKANCTFANTSTPVTNVYEALAVISEYAVSGDAVSTDSLQSNGGAVVLNAQVVPIFFGSAWNGVNPPIIAVMNAINIVMASPFVSQMTQYGLSNVTIEQPIQALNNPAFPVHQDQDAGDLVWQLIDDGHFPEPDEAGGRNVYIVFFPPGSVTNLANACGAHSAYTDHDFLVFDPDTAWVGYIDFNSGASSSGALDTITKVFTHELLEMVTNPEPDDSDNDEGWVMNRSINGGNEIGDACNNTVDRVDGVLVNAYWSNKHKACIIPKRHRWANIESDRQVLRQVPGPSGMVNLNNECHKGEYTWTTTYETDQLTFTATANGFLSPVYSWSIVNANATPNPIPEGFNGQVDLSEDAWLDDVNGSHFSSQTIPTQVTVSGNVLTLENHDPTLGSFDVQVSVTITESASADSANTSATDRIWGQDFQWDDRYEADSAACYVKYHERWAGPGAIPLPNGPDDRRWGWIDGLPASVVGARRSFVQEAGARAAALQHSAPAAANSIRRIAQVLGRVPAASLAPTKLVSGRIAAS
jgi:hypothetical protein